MSNSFKLAASNALLMIGLYLAISSVSFAAPRTQWFAKCKTENQTTIVVGCPASGCTGTCTRQAADVGVCEYPRLDSCTTDTHLQTVSQWLQDCTAGSICPCNGDERNGYTIQVTVEYCL